MQNTIDANSNKVASLTASPTSPSLGGTVTVIGTGTTGTTGASKVLDFTPAAYTSWRADVFQLVGTTITLSGGNTGTFTETLLIPPTSIPSTNTTNHTATYTFRVVGTTATATQVSPEAFISSGQPTKHSDPASIVNLPPVPHPVNTTTLAKSVTPAILTGPGTVTYTLTLINNSPANSVSLDSFVDTLPSSPANVTYVAGSTTYNGTPIADPFISGQTLTWNELFNLPAVSSRSLVFRASAPPVPGDYTNSAVAFMGTTQIDTTLATIDNAPATATFIEKAIPTLDTTPSPAPVTLGPNPVTLKDTAVLAGGLNPTGSITFQMFYNGGATPVDTETAAVSGNGTYTTPTGFTLPTGGDVTGTYQWHAAYSGDTNNTAAVEANPADEVVTVSAAPTLVARGGKLQDSAILSNGFHPTGSITFRLYAPGVDPTVGPAAYTETVTGVNGNGTYHTTVGFVASTPGVWHWVATFSGDVNNVSATSGPFEEPVTVPPPGVLSLTTTPSPAPVTLGSGTVTLTDTALLAGGNSPTGSITFTLNGPRGFTYT